MNERILARNLRALIDEATPYRFGQTTLRERASHRNHRAGLGTWSLFCAIALFTALAYAR